MIRRIWFMFYCWLFGPRPVMPRSRRSPLWRKVRREHLRREPACQWCGAGEAGGGVIARVIRALIRSLLQVHHILPFHARPDLELDPNNLITLCPKCHLKYGHLGNYLVSNPRIREDCAAHRAQLAAPQRSMAASAVALAGGALSILQWLDSIRRNWLGITALLLLVVIPAGALLVCGWLWLFERCPTITLVCTGVIPAIVGGIYITLRKISAHVI